MDAPPAIRATLVGRTAIRAAARSHSRSSLIRNRMPPTATRVTRAGVPIFKDSEVVGVIVVARRRFRIQRREIRLIETFADQAAIAIENVRILNERRRH